MGTKREKKTSLSNQTSVCSFSLQVAWSGISLIGRAIPVQSRPPRQHGMLCPVKLSGPCPYVPPTFARFSPLARYRLGGRGFLYASRLEYSPEHPRYSCGQRRQAALPNLWSAHVCLHRKRSQPPTHHNEGLDGP